MLLKLKSLIYQKTGIYLAHKEELEYITSKAFWKSFRRILGHKKNDMSAENVQGLLIGLWQTKHGFCLAINPREWKHIRRNG